MTMTETWVVVADAARARILRLERASGRLEALAEERHDESRAKASELMADRPGRSLDSSHAGGRHAMEPHTDPKAVERQRFARQLAAELDRAAQAGRFQDLVLVAAPGMLGELRAALSDHVATRVRQEIGKDLAGLELPQLQAHLVPLLALP
jgi:protein required for attachment to host cells